MNLMGRIIELDRFRVVMLIVWVSYSALVFLSNYIIPLGNSIALLFVMLVVVSLVWAMLRFVKRIDPKHLDKWQNILGAVGFTLSTLLALLYIGLGVHGGSIAQAIWSVGDGTLVEVATALTIGVALFLRSG